MHERRHAPLSLLPHGRTCPAPPSSALRMVEIMVRWKLAE
jgi:hypothetical protein